MGKNDYLDALKRAMAGIDPDSQARTLAYYEQRFIDGLAAGRSEEEIAADLDDPKKIAMTLRANSHREAFTKKKTPTNLARMLVSLFGLLVFNMFMIVPAMVYFSLLVTMFVCSIAFYMGGVVITASGLSGANELVINGPLKDITVHDGDWDGGDDKQTKVSISSEGIHVYEEKVPESATEALRSARQAAKEAHKAGEAARDEAHRQLEKSRKEAVDALRAAAAATGKEVADQIADEIGKAIDEDADEAANRSERAIRRVESVAERGIRISTDMDAGSRTTQSVFGLGMVIGSILLFLLSLVVSKYTVIGIRRYVEMNISLLKGQ